MYLQTNMYFIHSKSRVLRGYTLVATQRFLESPSDKLLMPIHSRRSADGTRTERRRNASGTRTERERNASGASKGGEALPLYSGHNKYWTL